MSIRTRMGNTAERLRSLLRYRPDRWAVSEWDRAYSTGQLAYFADIDELPRYSILTGYVRHLGGSPDIVDIGCGDGLLRSHLEGVPFSSYLGIDLSEAAVQRAGSLADLRTSFLCADVMVADIPQADVVVLNEVLYFAEDPGALLERVDQALRPDGHLLVSMWRHPGDRRLWALLRERFPLEDVVTVQNPASSLARRGWQFGRYRSAGRAK
jgi:SAM-dependent methyltransferase